VINGNMIAGFALIAVPAVYRNTGVMTFVTSHHGKVYEKDLGTDTLRVAAALTTFDPDASWREVDEATQHVAALTSGCALRHTGRLRRGPAAGPPRRRRSLPREVTLLSGPRGGRESAA
jgi:hypothetical protein